MIFQAARRICLHRLIVSGPLPQQGNDETYIYTCGVGLRRKGKTQVREMWKQFYSLLVFTITGVVPCFWHICDMKRDVSYVQHKKKKSQTSCLACRKTQWGQIGDFNVDPHFKKPVLTRKF